MPPLVKSVHYAIVAGLVALTVLYIQQMATGEIAVSSAWLPATLILTATGLVRRVVWGRFLLTIVSVMGAFVVAATLTPLIDDYNGGGSALERLFGSMPPPWLAWSIIALCATLVLLPAVVVGWRKHWFKAQLW